MQLDVRWYKPIPLLDGDSQNLILFAEGLDEWEGVPGVYMFCREFDGELSPLYIGKAENIAGRVRQHFKSNTRLMINVKKAARGAKVIVPGAFTPKPGQSTKKCIALIERALIEYSLAEGFELFNVQGTKRPTHRIGFSGFLAARNLTGQSLDVEIKR